MFKISLLSQRWSRDAGYGLLSVICKMDCVFWCNLTETGWSISTTSSAARDLGYNQRRMNFNCTFAKSSDDRCQLEFAEPLRLLILQQSWKMLLFNSMLASITWPWRLWHLCMSGSVFHSHSTNLTEELNKRSVFRLACLLFLSIHAGYISILS